MNEKKEPIYCLANKEIIDDHESRIVALENGSGGSYVAGDGISIDNNVITNTKPMIDAGPNGNVLSSDGLNCQWITFGKTKYITEYMGSGPDMTTLIRDVLSRCYVGDEIILNDVGITDINNISYGAYGHVSVIRKTPNNDILCAGSIALINEGGSSFYTSLYFTIQPYETYIGNYDQAIKVSQITYDKSTMTNFAIGMYK